MLVIPTDGSEALRWCESCRLNHVIPDLTNPEHAALWASSETAKRRLVSSLLAIGPPWRSKLHEDPGHGVMFDFLNGDGDGGGDAPVLTGHDDDLITLNIKEADDSRREQLPIAMHEPYRTLLGHLRHEIGHYYWDVLIDGSDSLAPLRELFGDETLDYSQAMDRHFQQGPPTDCAITTSVPTRPCILGKTGP